MICIGTLHIDTDGDREYNWSFDTVWVTDKVIQAVEAKQEEIEFQIRKLDGDWYNISVDGTRIFIQSNNNEVNLDIDLEEPVVIFNDDGDINIFHGGLVAVRDGMFQGELKSKIGFQSERAQWIEELRQMLQRLVS